PHATSALRPHTQASVRSRRRNRCIVRRRPKARTAHRTRGTIHSAPSITTVALRGVGRVHHLSAASWQGGSHHSRSHACKFRTHLRSRKPPVPATSARLPQ